MASLYFKKPDEPSKKKDHIPHSHKVRRKYRWFMVVLAALLGASLYINASHYLNW